MAWQQICATGDIGEDAMRAFDLAEQRVAVYRVEGRIYATDNICPHAFALLTDGWLDGKVVECPLHAAQFDIVSGEVLSGPTNCPLRTYAVRIEGGMIEVDLECVGAGVSC